MIHKKQGAYSPRSAKTNFPSSSGDYDAANGLRRTSVSISGSGSTSDTDSGHYSEPERVDSETELSPRGRGDDSTPADDDIERVLAVIEQTDAASAGGQPGFTQAFALWSLVSFGTGALISLPFTMLLLRDATSQATAIFGGGAIGLAVGGALACELNQRSLDSSAPAPSPV